MHVLFLTQVLPFPLDAGPKIRAYYVIRHLSNSGHRVTLASFTRESDRPESIDHLRRYCAEVHTVPMHRSWTRDALMMLQSLALNRPFLVTRDWVPEMSRLVRKILAGNPRPEVVHADQLWMAPYALEAQQDTAVQKRPRLVLDQHNAVYKIPGRLAEAEANPVKRWLLALEARKLVRYEKATCDRFDHVVWVTREDRLALFPNGNRIERPPSRETVIPIALQPPDQAPAGVIRDAFRITFMGGLHWPPNQQGILWFRREVWPAVKKALPEAVLTIIGRDPAPELVDGDASVEATGYLDDPSEKLAETAVFIVPLNAGGGMRVKILDAWSLGLPVVSTSIGAEGLAVGQGRNICLADTPDDFASAVVQVASKPDFAARLADGGRRTLDSLYDWRKSYQAWNEIYPCASFS